MRCRLEVVGDRELSFFPGVARGAVLPGFDYQTEAGAGAQTATDGNVQHLTEQHAAAWSGERLAHQRPVATVDDACQHTDDRAASATSDSYTCKDYSNGGPRFELCDGAEVSTLPGVQVLARRASLAN